MDTVTRIQNKISGLSEEQVDNHSLGYYMYAFPCRTAYVGDAIQYVLDINRFSNDGWGPWHKTGYISIPPKY